MSEAGRRFTDREVAMILRRASEIDDQDGRSEGGGLALSDLRDIAREVGISPTAIERAVGDLERRGLPAFLVGAPLVQKAVYAVAGELDQAAIARLIGVVDERASGTGSVTEALGAVRWTSFDRFSSTQVSVTPQDGATQIRVVEKYRPRLRRVVQLLPAAWGAMLAAPVLASIQPGPALFAGLLAGGVAVGVGAGRLAWSVLSARSERSVTALARELAREAENAVPSGVQPDGVARPGPPTDPPLG